MAHAQTVTPAGDLDDNLGEILDSAEDDDFDTLDTSLDTKKLADILGKEARYTFDLPDGCTQKDFEYAFNDQFPRSLHFDGFLNEGLYSIEFDAERHGRLRFGVSFSEPLGSDLDEERQYRTVEWAKEELEEFEEDFRGLVAELSPTSGELLDDGHCLAGCRFWRNGSGFCSKHAALAPKRAEYALRHSKRVHRDICAAIARYQAFAAAPLPDEFEESFCGDGWEGAVIFRSAGFE